MLFNRHILVCSVTKCGFCYLAKGVNSMALRLFAHNAKAYRAAIAMLEKHGKAAIVHPTGTGKSFIAFKLIEDNPDAKFLWLSPSEYIFKTQCESVLREDPEFSLQNVTFATYFKLIRSAPEEITAMQADYIILDEFHRCGAEHWSQGVDAVIAANPQAKLLGLSATHIRYLDGNRDMNEILFNNCTASMMTLGEAIVRGILPAPKYVTTVFKYQQQLDALQQRVQNLRSEGTQDTNQQYLDELRRALEMADGLDRVFQKHMGNKNGKYILFCSSYEHVQEMQRYAKEWFAGVNADIHSYVAYSADPSTSKAFADFKADDSDALKLLYCINMLNEGVHVKGISGVILFRPTVSPIIYKQQIGRALTAGDSATPLIFDIVNNFEGLCSIDTIKEEMRLAVQLFYREGKEQEIVTERFEVIEQVEDCRVLFERLENSLSNSWDQYFNAASVFYAEHGHLRVPRVYRTPGGLHLGEWVGTQRAIRAQKRYGTLTEQQIARLDSIGMVWESRSDNAWNQAIAHCEEYAKEHGNLAVPVRYVCADGYRLGAWVNKVCGWYVNGEKQLAFTPERIAQLETLGIEWSRVNARWERNYLLAAEYFKAHGDLMVAATYKTEDGYSLGEWVRRLRADRRAGRLTQEQIERLDLIGMFWGNRHTEQWERNFRAAEKYYQEHGHLDLNCSDMTSDGFQLGKWIVELRLQRKKKVSHLTPERIARLDSIGMQWDVPTSWEYRYELCKQYMANNNCHDIPYHYKTADGIWLGTWFQRQKRIYEGRVRDTKLKPEQQSKMRQLDIWNR